MPHLEYAVRHSGAAYAELLSCLPACSDKRMAALHAAYGHNYQSAQVTEVGPSLQCPFSLPTRCHTPPSALHPTVGVNLASTPHGIQSTADGHSLMPHSLIIMSLPPPP